MARMDVTSNNSKVQFQKLVRQDIRRIENIIEQYKNGECQKSEISQFIYEVATPYKEYIQNIYSDTHCRTERMYGGGGLTDEEIFSDLAIIKRKLEIFQKDECTPTIVYKNSQSNITVDSSNINTNSISMNIEISFDVLIEEFSNNGMLPEEEIEEIVCEIEKIKNICETDDKRNSKWSKLKPSIEWLSTKGVDIALKVMPLVINSLSN